MTDDGRNLLTHTRMQGMKTCPRKELFAYQAGIRVDRESRPIRIGTGVHFGLDMLGEDTTLEEAVAFVRIQFSKITPLSGCETEYELDEEITVRILCGYHWRYEGLDAGLFGGKVVACEQQFRLPIVNPRTGRHAQKLVLAGKFDKLVEPPDARLAVMEHKTTGENTIAPDSDYWRRLRLDRQIALYLLAARRMGYPVQAVIFDAIKKPGLSLNQVPILDIEGLKIVLDADGNRVKTKNGAKWRESASAKDGYVLRTRTETVEEFGERFNKDMAARPDWYFQRREIAFTEADILELEHDIWQTQKLILHHLKLGVWPVGATPGCCITPYRCEFYDLCANGFNPPDALEYTPDGYKRLDWVHPELEQEKTHDHETDNGTAAGRDENAALTGVNISQKCAASDQLRTQAQAPEAGEPAAAPDCHSG